MAAGNYRITLIFDGYIREYYCELATESSILFDALYRGASWNSLEVVDTSTLTTVQYIKKN